MGKKSILTKILAVAGTVFVWFPIFATLVTSIGATLMSGVFRFDYLMPAELFPAVLIGGGLLLWAALRAHSRRGLIGWGLLCAVGMLVGGQAFAVATGLASGETRPVGWIWALTLGSIIVYSLALIEVAVAGTLLVRDLFQQGKKASDAAAPTL
jgi:hypothetical protein